MRIELSYVQHREPQDAHDPVPASVPVEAGFAGSERRFHAICISWENSKQPVPYHFLTERYKNQVIMASVARETYHAYTSFPMVLATGAEGSKKRRKIAIPRHGEGRGHSILERYFRISCVASEIASHVSSHSRCRHFMTAMASGCGALKKANKMLTTRSTAPTPCLSTSVSVAGRKSTVRGPPGCRVGVPAFFQWGTGAAGHSLTGTVRLDPPSTARIVNVRLGWQAKPTPKRCGRCPFLQAPRTTWAAAASLWPRAAAIGIGIGSAHTPP